MSKVGKGKMAGKGKTKASKRTVSPQSANRALDLAARAPVGNVPRQAPF